MKSIMDNMYLDTYWSAPTRGPWIEIADLRGDQRLGLSAPTRGPWIEIVCGIRRGSSGSVGPHTGAVD